MERICPRSPRETMDGWVYLPRFIDKIRLALAGKLHSDYTENYTYGFDARWLSAAGVTAEQVIAAVQKSTTDGEVFDWVRSNVKRSAQEKAAFGEALLSHGSQDDAKVRERLAIRKQESGLSHRDDIKTFVDYIDADEHRL